MESVIVEHVTEDYSDVRNGQSYGLVGFVVKEHWPSSPNLGQWLAVAGQSIDDTNVGYSDCRGAAIGALLAHLDAVSRV